MTESNNPTLPGRSATAPTKRVTTLQRRCPAGSVGCSRAFPLRSAVIQVLKPVTWIFRPALLPYQLDRAAAAKSTSCASSTGCTNLVPAARVSGGSPVFGETFITRG